VERVPVPDPHAAVPGLQADAAVERLENLYMVDLCCDADLEPFYRRVGLQTWDRGMGIRNRDALHR